MQRILFYSSVSEMELFKITGFYQMDIKILENLGYRVTPTNSFCAFLKFWSYDYAFIYFWTKGLIPAVISKLFWKKVIFTGGIDGLDQDYNKNKKNYLLRKVFFKLCTIFSDANIIGSQADMDNIKKNRPYN